MVGDIVPVRAHRLISSIVSMVRSYNCIGIVPVSSALLLNIKDFKLYNWLMELGMIPVTVI